MKSLPHVHSQCKCDKHIWKNEHKEGVDLKTASEFSHLDANGIHLGFTCCGRGRIVCKPLLLCNISFATCKYVRDGMVRRISVLPFFDFSWSILILDLFCCCLHYAILKYTLQWAAPSQQIIRCFSRSSASPFLYSNVDASHVMRHFKKWYDITKFDLNLSWNQEP